MTRVGFLSLALACLLRPAAAADDWPKLLFKTTSHDFGTVARGAIVDYRFEMENPFVEDVHIVSVQPSCTCTKTSVPKPLLKTYQTGEIVATLDTRNSGQKEATLRVKFDRPFDAEYQLKVSAYIRSDVVFQPGVVQFGTVPQGQSDRKRVSVMYAGRSTWKILDVATDSAYLGLEIIEVGRTVDAKSRATQVTYDLIVTLKESTPPGFLKDQVVVRTDDPNQQAARIPLVVEGLVLPSLSASPAYWQLGVLEPGQTVTKTLVVHDRKPFRVVDVAGPDSQFRFTLPKEAKETQLIAAQFQAPSTLGKVSGKIRITTDVAGASPLEISVDGTVIAPSIAK